MEIRNELEIVKYKCEFMKEIYHNEEHRDQMAKEQAGRLQAAFSFIIAALFVLLGIVLEYCKNIPAKFLILSFSSITVVLIISLVLASMALYPRKRNDYPKATDFDSFVNTQKEKLMDEVTRLNSLANFYKKLHETYYKYTKWSFGFIKASSIALYIALGLCFLWFCVAIIIF